jgi:acyl-CoA dehydrogenase
MATLSPRAAELLERVQRFMDEHVYPAERAYHVEMEGRTGDARWSTVPAIVEELKARAKGQGLFNLFLPSVSGLTQYEYSFFAELMGRTLLAAEVFNCSAPDTGNMEVSVRMPIHATHTHTRTRKHTHAHTRTHTSAPAYVRK